MHSTVIWPIERFRPYEKNPRKNDHVVDQMAASIREFGFKIPMLSRSDGEVVDGHLRLKAALRLGLKELPTILCDEWTPAQVKAFRLLVNRSVNWAEWDEELVALEMVDIEKLDFDLALTGFEQGQVSAYLAQAQATPDATGFPALANGAKSPFQQMTFTLHDEQAEQVKAAIEASRAMGPFTESPNENGNGNALARICETFLTHADG